MRAAILAAGEGRRLRPHFSGPKPLLPLLGLPLIQRHILALRESGITQFVVVTGSYKEEIEEQLGDGSQWGVSITYVHNPDWRKGNGSSAYALRDVFREDPSFLLVMADHVYARETVRSFVQSAPEKVSADDVLVACDANLERIYDLDEATKIEAREGQAMRLGKQLARYNAVDCGLFVCTNALFSALSDAIASGKYALTDALNILAQQGKVKLHVIDGPWADVHDQASYLQAEKMLLNSLIPARDSFICRHINRKLSLRITKRLASTSLTPNQMTAVSFGVSLLSALSFFLGVPLLGGLLAQFSSVLDGVDGELARLKFKESAYGGLFDAILDRYADFLIVAGIAYGWWLQTDKHLLVHLVGFAALSGIPMSMLVKEKYKAITGKTYIPATDDGLWRYLPANRDGRLLIIMIGGILHWLPLTLIVLALVTHLAAIARLVQLRKVM